MQNKQLVLSAMEGSIFCMINLKSNYHQFRMRENDIPKAAFRTRYEHFEFTVMLFDLANIPAAFVDIMNRLLISF